MAPSVPGTLNEWKERVEYYGLAANLPELRLQDIRDQSLRPKRCRPLSTSLSGSTMSEDDFLFLRAIWPGFASNPLDDLALTVLHRVGFIRGDAYSRALERLGIRLGSGGKLVPAGSQSQPRPLGHDPPTVSYRDKAPLLPRASSSSTTPTSSKKIKQGLGIPEAPKKPSQDVASNELPLPKFIDALSSLSTRSTVSERVRLGIFFNAYNNFIIMHDRSIAIETSVLPRFNLAATEPPFESPTPNLDPMELGYDDIDFLEMAKESPSRVPSASRHPGQDSQGSPMTSTTNPALEHQTPEPEDDKPFRTPPDETIVTIFATNFFDSLSALAHPSTGHIMLPWRVQYRCGPRRQDLTYFNAAVDAIVPGRVNLKNPHYFCF